MELPNLENLLNEINYLKESEELLRAIYFCFDHYELCRILREKHFDGSKIVSKLDNHFNFDDSE